MRVLAIDTALEACSAAVLDTEHPQAAVRESIMMARGHAEALMPLIARVVDKAGNRVYGRTAKLGLADVQVLQGKYDNAIKIYQEAATDSNSQLPLDGVLMQLGRAYMKAGKKTEAAHAFTRVVEEFPTSAYAADARREMEEAKKG